ncbi:T9SS type B sorting domain-containing protein [Flavobacterium selenitireducens]|uniref:T9SS type B sorting domain-containing protein n=1 Tax=Flavobacterium selenitireducens TaxID=2722704 RepID=UPI00168AD65E|nr:gliding motility-associated C-terminal domain-containing protein [Flavobacterium selenitireducens]MBD3583679.1 T9SS type B sorting domain-containing protein [Flavobacterium selenitireducens]
MREHYLHFRELLLLIACLCATSVFAQLSDFTFSVTHTDETCSGNGSVFFNVSGTTPGATMLYSIYLLPDTTDPETVTSAATFVGLTAGTYLIVATQTLGSQTGTQQAQVIIADNVDDLAYAVLHQVDGCGLSADIVVGVSSGQPQTYEILSGPQTFPAQTQNTFTVNQGGVYLVRVTDQCGEAVVQTYTFSFAPESSVGFEANATSVMVSCNLIAISQHFSTTGGFNYPLDVHYTLTLPGGETQSSTLTIAGGANSSVTIAEDMIISAGQTYSYSVTVTDACGHTYTDMGTVPNNYLEPIFSPAGSDCDSVSYAVYYTTGATVTAAPAAYQNELPFELEITQNTAVMPQLPPGNYVVTAYDTCGEPHILELTVTEPAPVSPVALVALGCDTGRASVNIRAFEHIVLIEMVSAPTGYFGTLPQNLANALDGTNALRLADLVAGSYVFHLTDSCGNEWDFPVEIPELVIESQTVITQNCGSFNLDLTYSDNSANAPAFWLQKYFPAFDAWGHPQTGVLYTEGLAPTNSNSFQIEPGMNLNLLFSGKMRLVAYKVSYSTAEELRHCLKILETFDILSAPVILDTYSFVCAGGNFDVLVEAVGMAPMSYQITHFNAAPFVVDNGNSPTFTGLLPGVYNFRVVDVCGNIVNRVFEIAEPYPMQITGEGNCEGQPLTLSVPNLPHLGYSWYFEGGSPVLGTSAILEIPALSAGDIGTYYVTIFTDNPESCINVTLSYVVTDIIPAAAAGQDSNEQYCGSPGVVDLNAFLVGNFQTGGTWAGNPESGTIAGNVWDASSAAAGTYTFTYTKTSECGAPAISTHTFVLHPRPENPIPFLEQDVCEQGDIVLLATTIPGATYVWTGPDGFTSFEQNPSVPNATSANNGTYAVQAFLGDCASDVMPIEIVIGELPEFALSAACANDKMMITATAVAHGDDVTYVWSGPNGFGSSENPTDITGQHPGEYSLTVTNAAGCSETFTQTVDVTICSIPKGVSANGDGANDTFDLGGFGDGLKVKIFNRYGMVVYEMDNYVDQWHGQSKNGNDLPSATYYYHIRNATGEERTGWVYLLRD